MKKFIIILLTLFCSQVLFGQNDTTNTTSSQFVAFVGIQSPDLTELNEALSLYNYPQFDSYCMSLGLGTVIYAKNILFQADVYYYEQSKSKDTITSTIDSRGLGLSFGYAYLNKKKFQMYSSAGIYYSWTTVNLSNDFASSITFNDYSSEGNQLKMTTKAFLVNISTQINYFIKISKKPDNKDYWILGIRGGYYFPISISSWKMNKTKQNDSPNINPGGYYAMIVLGFNLY